MCLCVSLVCVSLVWWVCGGCCVWCVCGGCVVGVVCDGCLVGVWCVLVFMWWVCGECVVGVWWVWSVCSGCVVDVSLVCVHLMSLLFFCMSDDLWFAKKIALINIFRCMFLTLIFFEFFMVFMCRVFNSTSL